MSDPMSDENSQPTSDQGSASGGVRPPAFPSIDHQPSGSVWRPASDDLLAPAPAPVTQAVTRGPRTPLWRWLIALVATLAVVGVVAGIGYMAIHRVGSPSAISHYAPADTAMYAEVNLNLPGDQHDQLASFLGHFPGFADPSSFQQKIDDTLNQLLVSSGSGLTWQDDVQPWFGNEMAMFGNPWSGTLDRIGPTPSLSTTGMAGTPYLVALSVTDRAQLEQLVNPRLTDAGATSAEYAGQTLWTIPNLAIDLAITDDALLVGDEKDVKTALDVHSGSQASLADDDFFLTQLGALHADRLGTMYLDYGKVLQAMTDSMSSLGQLAPGMPSLDSLVQSAAFKMVAEIRAEGDHLALTERSSHPTGDNVPPLPSNRHTALAERMPADSLVYFETRDLGQAIKYMVQSLTQVMPAPSGSGGSSFGWQSIGEMLGTQPQDFLDFVKDVAVSASYSNDKLGIGLVATVDDEAVARTRVERLLSVVRMAAAGGTSGVSVEDQTHGDATITVIHVSDASGAAAGLSPTMSNFDIGVTVANGQLIIGLDDFVANALDRQSGDSLAAQPTFKAAADTAGDNSGIIWADLAGIRTALEAAMPASGMPDYQQNVKPFLTPFDYLLSYSVTDGDISESHVLLYVK